MTLPLPTSDTNLRAVAPSIDRRSVHASKAGPTAAAATSLALQLRVLQLQKRPIEYVEADPEESIEGAVCLDQPVSDRMNAEDERRLFLAMNLAKQKVAQHRGRLSAEHPDVALLEELEWNWHRASQIRRHLIEVFFKLAVSVARRQVRLPSESDDLVGQASLTLIRSIERFDAGRGFRFSSYATRAIQSELHRYVTQQRKRAPIPVDASELDRLRDYRSTGLDHWRRGLAVRALECLMRRLERREAHVVRSRFGLADEPGQLTLQALADQFGVSRERVRQLEQRALRKLRQLAAELDERAIVEQFVDSGR